MGVLYDDTWSAHPCEWYDLSKDENVLFHKIIGWFKEFLRIELRMKRCEILSYRSGRNGCRHGGRRIFLSLAPVFTRSAGSLFHRRPSRRLVQLPLQQLQLVFSFILLFLFLAFVFLFLLLFFFQLFLSVLIFFRRFFLFLFLFFGFLDGWFDGGRGWFPVASKKKENDTSQLFP